MKICTTHGDMLAERSSDNYPTDIYCDECTANLEASGLLLGVELNTSGWAGGVSTNLDFAIFQNHGHKGLYGGLEAKDIHARKGLKKSQKFLDHMGSTELAANLFRATQTEEKLKRDNVQGKANANKAHFEVGKKVRDTITELGGTLPEELPTPTESVSKLERNIRKQRLENKRDD